MRRTTVWMLALILGLTGAGDVAAQETELPEGVTEDMISSGEQLFRSAGLCFACHGQDGGGMPGVGPDLTDGDWLHIDGDYTQIVDLILRGVPGEESKSGVPMVPKGGSQLTDEQVRAVASYVWKLSHGSD